MIKCITLKEYKRSDGSIVEEHERCFKVEGNLISLSKKEELKAKLLGNESNIASEESKSLLEERLLANENVINSIRMQMKIQQKMDQMISKAKTMGLEKDQIKTLQKMGVGNGRTVLSLLSRHSATMTFSRAVKVVDEDLIS